MPKYKRDLVHKLKILKQEFQSLQPQGGHCRMEVSREEIFEVRLQILLIVFLPKLMLLFSPFCDVSPKVNFPRIPHTVLNFLQF